MLLLLGVKMDRIRLEKQLLARTLVLPWVPHWNPVQIASFKGIAKEMAKEMTTKLIGMSFPRDEKELVKPIFVASGLDKHGQYKPVESIDDFLRGTKKRLIVYLARAADATRAVVNENELLQELQDALHEDYQLVILGPTPPYSTVESLLVLWQRYAKIVSRAKVLIGPHGGGLNNVMWTPEDCHMVEFNEFPDDEFYTKSHGETPVRSVFLTAFFAKAGSGEYYNIEASRKHPKNFYEGKIRIAPRDLMLVLLQIEGGIILKRGYRINRLKNETHEVWSDDEQEHNKRVGEELALAAQLATKGL